MRAMPLMILLGCLAVAGPAVAGRISPQLEAQFAQKKDDAPVKVLVVMHDQVDIQALDWTLHEQRVDLATRHVTVIQTLQSAAEGTQRALLTDLTTRKDAGSIEQFQPHWLVNAVTIKATEAVIREIAARDDVDVVEPNIVPELIEPLNVHAASADKDGDRPIGITPGLVSIGARRVWNELGIRGEGALIGSNDTGVSGTHPALASRWRGLSAPWQQCWHDVLGTGTTFPVDNNGHGTHCTGTMTGLATGDTIGVAPAAQWIASNVINQGVGGGFDGDIIDCFEWFTDPDGNPFTMDDVPDVIQNSWRVNEGFGYPDCDSRWWNVLDACEAAGPVIVFAAGNEGPNASTIGSPSDRATTPYNVFSVGATNATYPFGIAGFSSRGPAGPACGPVENRIKPEVSAPGVSIYSAAPGGGYQYMDGTSMATPHVAGVVALMRSANPNVDAITIKQVLMDTARDLGPAGDDNTYGRGFIDAYQAVLAVANGLGTVAGVVLDGTSGQPVVGARITVEGAFQTDITETDGSFSLTLPVGDHTLRAEAFGYVPGTRQVAIAEDEVTTVQISLARLPRHTISGIVHRPNGQPAVGATVSVNAAIAPVVSDASGRYSLEVPEAAEYGLSASFGTVGVVDVRVPAMRDLVLDLYLRTINGDGFETGDMTGQPWFQSGGAPWFAQSDVVHSGAYAARSGAIGNTALSQMQLFVTLPVAGEIRFWLRTSSESADQFTFTLGNTTLGTWSGETPWTQVAFPIAAGTQSLRFKYQKDGSGAAGQDCAWVDDISFPSGDTPTPNIVVAPVAVNISMGSPGTTSVPLYVFNQGAAPLSFTAAETAPWLQLNPTSGAIATGTYQTILLDVNAAGMPEGSYETTVAIASNDPDQPSLNVPVVLQLGGLTAIDDLTPAAFGLTGVVPNPFNPMTTLHFNLPASQQATLAVYDVQGRLVRTILDAVLPAGAGEARWDGTDNTGRGVSSGTYFARLTSPGVNTTRTLTLVR